MAEETKKQVKNTEKLVTLNEVLLQNKREQRIEAEKEALARDIDIDKTTTLDDLIKKRRKSEATLSKEMKKGVKDLEADIANLEKRKAEGEKISGHAIEGLRKRLATRKAMLPLEINANAIEKRRTTLLEKTAPIINKQAEGFKSMADGVENLVKKLPGGEFLTKALGIDGLGDKLQEEVTEEMANHILKTGNSTKVLNVGMDKAKDIIGDAGKNAMRMGKHLMKFANPVTIFIGVATAAFLIVRKIRKEARDLGTDLGASTSQSMKLLGGLKLQEQKFKALGLDSAKLKTTLGTIADEFGNLENVTAANAANVEKMAQNLGVTGTEVVKFNKVMTDLTGMTFDQATATAQAAANLAKQENVATGKVLKDISTSAKDFARFSMDGAEGLAKAAVAAAKVGANLSTIVEAADSLLKFEDSITAQFEAQVLTGRQINTERARQLALDGDIAGLTTEIQSIVGQVGDIQSLNVIQRKSVADAIGISVEDLLKISRGEAAQAQATVQDKLDITNKLLAQQLGVSEEQLDNMGKPVEMSAGLL